MALPAIMKGRKVTKDGGITEMVKEKPATSCWCETSRKHIEKTTIIP